MHTVNGRLLPCDPDEHESTERVHSHWCSFFQRFVAEQKDAFTSKHEWDLSRGIWYCCQVNKQCSVTQRQLRRSSDAPFELSRGSRLAKISDDLFGYCPWHTYTPVQYVVSHPVSLPLPMGQVLHAFSTRAWLVPVCQPHLDGPMQRFSCNHLPDWSSRINALTSPALTTVLTMLLWCCFFCRDCGGSGKRKSGKDLKFSHSCLSTESVFTAYLNDIVVLICDIVNHCFLVHTNFVGEQTPLFTHIKVSLRVLEYYCQSCKSFLAPEGAA